MSISKRHRILAAVCAAVLAFAMLLPMEQTSAKAKSGSGSYWLKVNKKTCVVTVYKKSGGKWKAVRAMRCSVGKPGNNTPAGIYHIASKWRWLNMKGCWGQYVSQFNGDYLFHSCWYYGKNKARQNITEYNKLGRPASHGCVRLATIDSKWVYENCRKGTKVTIFSGSSKKDKLGKPALIRSHSGWDPTDPTKGNPNFKLKKAIVKAKSKDVQYGRKISLKKGISAKNPNANENITSSVKVVWIRNGGKKTAVNTKKLTTYKIRYSAGTAYCRKGYKTIAVRIVDRTAAVISGTENISSEAVQNGQADLITGVTAKLSASKKNLTGRIAVTIKAPSGETSALTKAQAKKYTFNQEGAYTIVYKVVNPYTNKAYKVTRIVNVNAAQQSQQSDQTDQTAEEDSGTAAAAEQ